MNNNDIIRHRLDQGLSGVTVSLQHRVKLMDEIFGGKKVKRKLTYGLILAIVLMLLTVSALAVIVWNLVFESSLHLQLQYLHKQYEFHLNEVAVHDI